VESCPRRGGNSRWGEGPVRAVEENIRKHITPPTKEREPPTPKTKFELANEHGTMKNEKWNGFGNTE
jgi:hypothetical protein